ncbi:MAG: MobA/MobL family protein [Lachnospiraceae bacterium]|nr:MobA/MobL family protein [Lachnospiraceae bacterium]
MTVKNISTRAKICGRSAKCTGGHSAVEQSSYISREKMYCEYDGQTYYPKYSEDLVHCEVLLPENAPEKYKNQKNPITGHLQVDEGRCYPGHR